MPFWRKQKDPAVIAVEEVAEANFALRSKDNVKAARAYERAAAAYGRAGQEAERARYLLEAARVYETFDVLASARVTETAIDDLVLQGQLRRAAAHAMTLGDVCRTGGELRHAMQWYARSAAWYEQEGSKLLGNRALVAYADLAALHGDPTAAADAYAKVAKTALGTPSAAWTVKEYCQRAVLALLIAKEYQRATEQRLQFCEWDRQFEMSRENDSLEAVVHAAATRSVEQFENALFAWDQHARLSAWIVEAALLVKRQMTQEELL